MTHTPFTRWIQGRLMPLLVITALLAACPSQRLKPKTLRLDTNSSATPVAGSASNHNRDNNDTGNPPANASGNSNLPTTTVKEDFTNPINTVSTFLSAIPARDLTKLERTLAARSPRRAEFAKFKTEPWRWSALRCTIWLFAGVGPGLQTVADECHVVLEPPPTGNYHLKFHLRLEGGKWLINTFDAVYVWDKSEFQPNEIKWPASYEISTMQLSEFEEAKLAPPTRDFARQVFDARHTPQALIPPHTEWRQALPLSEQPAFTEAEFNRQRSQIMTQMERFAALAVGSTFEGSYEERRFRIKGTGSNCAIAEVRVCLTGGKALIPKWSFRLTAVCAKSDWLLVAVNSTDPEAWPRPKIDRDR